MFSLILILVTIALTSLLGWATFSTVGQVFKQAKTVTSSIQQNTSRSTSEIQRAMDFAIEAQNPEPAPVKSPE